MPFETIGYAPASSPTRLIRSAFGLGLFSSIRSRSTVYAMRKCFQIHHGISPAAVAMKNKSFSALIPCNTFTCVYCETLRFPISDQADSMRFIDALIWIPCCDELSNCCVTMTSGLECYSMTSESITGDERKKWEWMSKFQESLITQMEHFSWSPIYIYWSIEVIDLWSSMDGNDVKSI